MTGKLHAIQILRAIAVLLVVMYHTTFTEQKYTSFAWLAAVQQWGFYGVDLFFVISGFIITHTSLRQIEKHGAYKKFLLHRAIRIYPLYWLFTLLILGVYTVAPGMVNTSSGSAPDILGSLLLTAPPNKLLLAVGWTLTFELYFYIVFSLVYFLGKHSLPLIWTAWLSAIAALNMLTEPSTQHFALQVVASPLALEFMLGSLVCYVMHRYKFSAREGFLSLGLAALYVFTAYPFIQNLSLEWSRTMHMAIPCALLVVFAISIESRIKPDRRLTCWLILIGNASYSIYLSHVLVISAVGRALKLLITEHSMVMHIGWIALCWTSAIVGGIICYRLIEKPIHSRCIALIERNT